MKTERMTIVVTPGQKRAITAQAKKLKLSAGEVIRRAVENYRPNEEEMGLNALGDELDRAVKGTRKAIKEALAETQRTLDHFAAKAGTERRTS